MRISWRKLNNLIDYVFHRLQEDPPTGVSGAPTDNNIMIWNAVIFGPHDTPFEDGTFKLTIEFTEEYPNKPPTVRFVSKMFHPNVYADGGICLDILQNRWSPTYDVSAILTSIQVICNRFATKSIYQRPLTIIIDFSLFSLSLKVVVERPQSEFASKFNGCSALQGESSWIWVTSEGLCGTELYRLAPTLLLFINVKNKKL